MALQGELIRVVQRLSFCRDLDAVMAVLRETARELTGADGVTVVLREGDLCHYVEENAIGPLWKGRRFPMKACISGWCMLHRAQVAIADIYDDPRIPHEAYEPTFVKSLAMVPIRSEDPIGAIGAYWATHHQASAQELGVLQYLGDSAALAIANVQLIESLEEVNRRKDEFLSMLAHELRNPLAPIRNALQILRLQAGEADAVEWAREMMDRQVQHMSRLIDDLLDVSRLTSGKVALRRERMDLTRLVRQGAGDRRGTIEESGLTLRLEIPETPIWVMGDSARLAQVLGNVLDNAGKFTPDGGKLTVRLAADEGNAVLAIHDTGIGIEPELLPHVFDAFVQADPSLDRSQGGLGLGLSVAKGLLDLHGGTIAVASEGNGQGTEITIRLPLEPELPALAGAPIVAQWTGGPSRILVVEDNRDSAESLRMLLEICGYEVTVAYTGREGVAAAQATRPSVVLCDIGLPEMDGYAVAEALRRNPDMTTARLIAVTGYGQDEDRQRAFAAGFDAHLVKPVDPEKLLGTIGTRSGRPSRLPSGW